MRGPLPTPISSGFMGRRAFVCGGAGACAVAALAAMGCGLSVPTAPDAVSGALKVSDYASLATVGGLALIT